MTMRQRMASVALALALAGLAACGSVRPSKYYALAIPASAPAPVVVRPSPVALLIGRLSAPHLYRDDRIVYRTGSERLGTYAYHRWAEPPTEMLEAILLRLLRESGRYRSVQFQRSNARGEYIVRGHLYSFEEIEGRPVSARVAFELELYENKTGTTVWSQFYSHDEPVNGKEVEAVVEALDRNAQRGLQQVVAGIEQYFASHPPN